MTTKPADASDTPEPEHIARFRAFKFMYDRGQAYASDEAIDGMKLLTDYEALRAERDELAKDAGLLREIRRWLNEGATIKATDLAKPVFTLLSDGSFDMGVTVTFPGAALAAQEKP